MIKNKKAFTFERGFLLLSVLINVLILKTAYIVMADLYWLLLLSVPMLFFAIYFERKVAKKTMKLTNLDFNLANAREGDTSKDNLVSSEKTKADELTIVFGNSSCALPYLSSIICFESVSADQNCKLLPRQIIFSEDNDYTQDIMQRLNDSLLKDEYIWRIGPDYKGCRDNNFNFNAAAFKVNAVNPQVKMIELKLPGLKFDTPMPARNISYAKQTGNGGNMPLNTRHTAFGNSESMVIFLDYLRELSGKKPVGISLHITDKKEFHEMCYAFCKTKIFPDFIVVEGCPKNNNFLNKASFNHGMPLFDALHFVSKTLEIYGLSKEIKIMAASEIHSAFDVLKLRALGADAISMRNNFARHYKTYQKDNGIPAAVFLPQNREHLRNTILNSTINVMQAWGYINIKEITLSSFFKSLDLLQKKAGDRDYDRTPLKDLYQKNNSAEVFLN